MSQDIYVNELLWVSGLFDELGACSVLFKVKGKQKEGSEDSKNRMSI